MTSTAALNGPGIADSKPACDMDVCPRICVIYVDLCKHRPCVVEDSPSREPYACLRTDLEKL
jgi:hypothetical protein